MPTSGRDHPWFRNLMHAAEDGAMLLDAATDGVELYFARISPLAS
jgi:hypothetical protein